MPTPRNTGPDPGTRSGVPSWLLEKNPNEPVKTRSSGTDFIAKTIRHFSEVFENELYCERYARKSLLLQCLDPRVKVIVLFAFLLFSAFASSMAVLLALAVTALVYAKLSGIDMKGYVRRIWAYIPLIVFVFSIPGASSLFTKGIPLFYVLRPGAFGIRTGLYFTVPGIEMAVRLALRPGISLSFAFLLLLTTRWSHITGALSRMHLPLLIISILNMAYRYLFIMAEMANSMMEARFLRTVGRLGTRDNRRFMSRSIACLFIRSQFFSEGIYDAMVCRGFTGKPVSIDSLQINAADILFVVNNSFIFLVLIAGERLF